MTSGYFPGFYLFLTYARLESGEIGNTETSIGTKQKKNPSLSKALFLPEGLGKWQTYQTKILRQYNTADIQTTGKKK